MSLRFVSFAIGAADLTRRSVACHSLSSVSKSQELAQVLCLITLLVLVVSGAVQALRGLKLQQCISGIALTCDQHRAAGDP